MATRDPVGLALASLGAGSAAGAAVMTGGMIVLRTVQRSGVGGPDSEMGITVLTAATFVGIVTAAGSGATLAYALDDLWRRAVIGALSVFGTALLAGLAVPADMLGGRAGLAAYLALLLVAFARTVAAARRSSRT